MVLHKPFVPWMRSWNCYVCALLLALVSFGVIDCYLLFWHCPDDRLGSSGGSLGSSGDHVESSGGSLGIPGGSFWELWGSGGPGEGKTS